MLNGGLLGTGTPTPFAFVAITATALATVVISVTGTNNVGSSVRAVGQFFDNPHVRTQLAIAAEGRASATLIDQAAAGVFVNASLAGLATHQDNFGRVAYFGSTEAAAAVFVAEAWRGTVAQFQMTYAHATTYTPYFTEDAPTSDERVMLLPDEGRQMELSA